MKITKSYKKFMKSEKSAESNRVKRVENALKANREKSKAILFGTKLKYSSDSSAVAVAELYRTAAYIARKDVQIKRDQLLKNNNGSDAVVRELQRLDGVLGYKALRFDERCKLVDDTIHNYPELTAQDYIQDAIVGLLTHNGEEYNIDVMRDARGYVSRNLHKITDSSRQADELYHAELDLTKESTEEPFRPIFERDSLTYIRNKELRNALKSLKLTEKEMYILTRRCEGDTWDNIADDLGYKKRQGIIPIYNKIIKNLQAILIKE